MKILRESVLVSAGFFGAMVAVGYFLGSWVEVSSHRDADRLPARETESLRTGSLAPGDRVQLRSGVTATVSEIRPDGQVVLRGRPGSFRFSELIRPSGLSRPLPLPSNLTGMVRSNGAGALVTGVNEALSRRQRAAFMNAVETGTCPPAGTQDWSLWSELSLQRLQTSTTRCRNESTRVQLRSSSGGPAIAEPICTAQGLLLELPGGRSLLNVSPDGHVEWIRTSRTDGAHTVEIAEQRDGGIQVVSANSRSRSAPMGVNENWSHFRNRYICAVTQNCPSNPAELWALFPVDDSTTRVNPFGVVGGPAMEKAVEHHLSVREWLARRWAEGRGLPHCSVPPQRPQHTPWTSGSGEQ